MRRFWIDIRKGLGGGVSIEVGKGTEERGFMRRSWARIRYKSWPPTHIAFAAWDNKIEYQFCLNQTSKGLPHSFLLPPFSD